LVVFTSSRNRHWEYPNPRLWDRNVRAAANRRLGFFEGRIRLAEDFDDWPEDIAVDLGITD
jgi:hypothetical protein